MTDKTQNDKDIVADGNPRITIFGDAKHVSIKPNYAFIAAEIRRRLGYLPDDIERVLEELASEQHN